ncbi:hypothetical protein J8L84_19585 [Alteromonas sp. MMG017]|uniref:hypothetical protein n=1 Tax=Alteromonas sp. MMG017 TaxID=2822692 RepID=UPI001B3A419C|nr:hypothetical protein [Alteromonas sp. MMG017]MBQ4831489.1 hypothetical protein [Alteromonas sp. MMG017]
MREVFLTPEHSKWWLLSPGVTIYYDKIKICESDYNKVLKEGAQSSYHNQIAMHLDSFSSRDDFPEIEIVKDVELGLAKEDYTKRSEVIKNLLFRRAQDRNDPTLEPKDLVKLTIDAFQHWIEYNQSKVRYLRKDEAYRNLLGSELLPAWEERKKSLIEIYQSPESEILGRFSDNKDAISTFSRLLASCSRCMDLIDSGKQIYDPMLTEYLPAIQLLEGRRVSNQLIKNNGDVSEFFEAFRIQMAKYSEILPVDISLNEVGQSIQSYKIIRDNLTKLDKTISSITDSDLASSLSEIRGDIGSLVSEIDRLSKGIGYGFWVSGLIWTVASILGGPDFSKRIEDAAVTSKLMSKGVGRFAGAYSLITDRVVMQQDTVVNSTAYHEVDYEYFKKHYWDFGKKNV